MLTAEGVTKAFDGPDRRITVLDGATLSLAAGTRLGLAGPSGCGKSTLTAVLALLLAPNAGRVVLDGDPVTGHGLAVPKQMRRQVQLIWQSPRQAADPRLTLAPRYLLCDEPTSMLDVSTQAALLAAVAEEQECSGLGVLLITHDLAVARHWCNEVIDGRDLTPGADDRPVGTSTAAPLRPRSQPSGDG